MGSVWSNLHANFKKKLQTLAADKWLKAAGERHECLARFSCPAELLAAMRKTSDVDVDLDLNTKDAILRALIVIYQGRLDAPPEGHEGNLQESWEPNSAPTNDFVAGAQGRELALAALWLSMWGGLDTIRCRLLHRFSTGEECTSSVSSKLLQILSQLDVCAVNRYAGTITLSVQRDVMRELQQKWRDEGATARVASWRRRHNIADEEVAPDLTEHCGTYDAEDQVVPLEMQVSDLIKTLRPVAGVDSELLVAVLAIGVNQDEAGAMFGHGPDAARKRVQRATARVRKEFDEGCPTSPLRMAFGG